MRLSKNFTLDEFTDSPTAARLNINMIPPAFVVTNIQTLVADVLQPLRDHFEKSVFINSGYRPVELNEAVGGSKESDHLTGSAADIRVQDTPPYIVVNTIIELKLPVRQAINEFSKWTHVSVGQAHRSRFLHAMHDSQGRVIYSSVEFHDYPSRHV